ncbi:hypothetical protein [Aquifex sp.]
MGKQLLTFLMLITFGFGVEAFTQWWKEASKVCLAGTYKDFSGKDRELKPFCCVIHRVEVKQSPPFLKKKGIKESIVVVASCRGSFFGIINYDGGTYAVNGNVGISKNTPIGVIKILNEKEAHFEVCQGSADFERGCLSEPIGRGYIVKPE